MRVSTGPPATNVSNLADIYDAYTGEWSTAALSQARGQLAATSVGPLAFFGGGEIDIPGAGGTTAVSSSNVVDIYNSSTNQWSTNALSQARSDLAATSVGNLAIFAGGIDWINGNDGVLSNAVDIYNTSTGQWTTAALSVPRYGLTATTVGTDAIFAGGVASGGLSNVVDIFNTATGKWSTATLSQSRSEISATSVDGNAIFAGGNISFGRK